MADLLWKGNIKIPTPETRIEKYLHYIGHGGVFEELPPPEFKIDFYLYEICRRGLGNKTMYVKATLDSNSPTNNYIGGFHELADEDIGKDLTTPAKVTARFKLTGKTEEELPQSIELGLFSTATQDMGDLGTGFTGGYTDATPIPVEREVEYTITREFNPIDSGNKMTDFKFLKPVLSLNNGEDKVTDLELYELSVEYDGKKVNVLDTVKDTDDKGTSKIEFYEFRPDNPGGFDLFDISNPTELPDIAKGQVGDYAIHKDNGRLYKKHEDGTWKQITDLAVQEEVIDVTVSDVDKDATEGANGDIHINEATGNVFHKRGDAWTYIGNIKPVDNLVDGGKDRPLSAEQGKVLKGLVDGKINIITKDVAPTQTDGVKNDYYINTSTGELLRKTSDTQWQKVGSVKEGNEWHVGSGEPTNANGGAFGGQGDFYLDRDTGNVWEKRDNATNWEQRGTIKTPIVDDLTTGGTTSALSAEQGKVLQDTKVNKSDIATNLTTDDDTKVLSASQGVELKRQIDAKADLISEAREPLNTDGTQGDYFINTTSGVLFKKNDATNWSKIGTVKDDLELFIGNGAPTGVNGGAFGKFNDLHIDRTTGEIYENKGQNNWQVIGKIKHEVEDVLTSTSTTNALSANMGKKLNDEKVAKADIVNGLTQVQAGKVLDASQGKALNDLIELKPDITVTADDVQGSGGNKNIHINKATGDVYSSDINAGTWENIGNIKRQWSAGVGNKNLTDAGNAGDLYLNTDNSTVFLKEADGWKNKGRLSLVSVITGTQQGTPNAQTGKNNDLYVNTNSNEVFFKDANTGWKRLGSLNEMEWFYGDAIPDTTLGKDNDYYIDRNNGKVYKKENGTWTDIGFDMKGQQGIEGPKGDKGDPFAVAKTFPSVADMEAGFANDGVLEGQFVVIASANGAEDVDNAKLYVRGVDKYNFITDLSGAQGIKGDQGERGPQGLQGIQGPVGQTGPAGAKGDTGVGIQAIDVTPSTVDGGDNLVKITMTDGTTKEFAIKNGTQGSTGVTGNQGTAGAVWHNGTGNPTTVAGAKVGDYYLNTADGTIHKMASANQWTNVGSIKGPAGANGPAGAKGEQGVAGAKGADGATWHNGTTSPPPATVQGKNGDFYLNTNDGDLFKMEGNAWQNIGSLRGPIGPAGPQGTGGAGGANVVVKDDLVSTSPTEALSANQGRLLKTQLDTKPNGVSVYTGQAPNPVDTVGKQNDVYVNVTNGDVFVKETATTWGAKKGSIKDTPIINDLTTGGATSALSAEQGKNLKGFIDRKLSTGSINPLDNVGSVGDFFVNKTTKKLFEKTAQGWEEIGDLNVATTTAGGGTAVAGPAGPKGTDGATWLHGAGAPDNRNGKIGDYYLDTTTGNVHTKGAGNTWGASIVTLKGQNGAKGDAGATGLQGPKGDAGNRWHHGTGAPQPQTGNNGDYYINTQTGDYYNKNTAGAWTNIGRLTGGTGGGGTGVAGPAGPAGANGKNGATWHSGPADPLPATAGEIGDFYLNTTDGSVHKKTGANAWTEVIPTLKGANGQAGAVGPAGAKGADGATWHTGTQAPPTIVAKDGDLYLNTQTGALHKRQGGAWVASGSLRGPAGPAGQGGAGQGTPVAGPPGPQGPAGKNGATWHNGAQAPAGTLGEIGDYYLNTTDGTVHKKVNANTWTPQGSIKGPKGDAGVAGPAGTVGPAGPAGADGSVWHSGPTEPVQGTGKAGDYYLKTDDGAIYKKEVAGNWTPLGSIRGPQGPAGAGGTGGGAGVQGPVGPAGPAGPTGPAGKAGTVWHNGGQDPTTGTAGAEGDFYLNNTTGAYFKKVGQAWQPQGSLKGATGQTGPAGPIGPQGLQGEKGLDGATGPAGPAGPIGPIGPQGPAGQNGLQGPAGADGSVWHTGVANPPTADIGKDGDYYLNTQNGQYFGRTAGTWNPIGSLLGPAGPAGQVGPAGANGLDGATGPAGPAGAQGPAGTNGSKWYSGAGTPDATGTVGENQDFYINTQDGSYWSKATGTWVQQGSLVGPAGPQGVNATPYEHPPNHPTSFIVFDSTNNAGQTLSQFFDAGGTIGGGVTANTGDIIATAGNVRAPQGNVVAGNILAGNNLRGNTDPNQIAIGDGNCKMDTTGNRVAMYTTADNNGITVSTNGTLETRVAGNVVHSLHYTGTLTSPSDITSSGGNIKAGPDSALIGNRLAGGGTDTNRTTERISLGTGTCRIDVTGGDLRFFSGALGQPDAGIRIASVTGGGDTHIMHNGVAVHMFHANGTKTGGSMEIDGTIYGMSPTDSPQTLIEYVEYDVDVLATKTIQLDSIYAKMISKYAVFSSNPDIRIVEKGVDSFKVEGTGKADFVIKGQRKGAQEYYKIMGGINHGVAKEQTS